jgi:hypothetical protein
MRPSSNRELRKAILRGVIAAAAGSLFAVARAASPTVCTEPDETPDTCSAKIEAIMGSRAISAAVPTPQDADGLASQGIAKVNSGPSSTVPQSGASTTNDFVPFLQALLGSAPVSEENQEALALEFSNFLPLPRTIQHKFGVQLLGASVYAPLDGALVAADRAADRDALKAGIAANDDVTISISLSPASKRAGRDPSFHSELWSAFLSTALSAQGSPGPAEMQYRELVGKLGAVSVDEGFGKIPDAKVRAEFVAAYEEKERETYRSTSSLRQSLKETGFFSALDLLANNPQWSFVSSYRLRDDVTGPNEWSAKFQYEIGWPNLNSATTFARCNNDASCVQSNLARYLVAPETQRTLRAAPRIAISAAYTQRKRYTFELPSTVFTYEERSYRSLVGSVAYGQFLTGKPGDAVRMRLDVKFDYEDVSNDPQRNNRGVASANVTYPVADGFFISVGAVYATKPEFRGDVDKELSARAGLTYKLAKAP